MIPQSLFGVFNTAKTLQHEVFHHKKTPREDMILKNYHPKVILQPEASYAKGKCNLTNFNLDVSEIEKRLGEIVSVMKEDYVPHIDMDIHIKAIKNVYQQFNVKEVFSPSTHDEAYFNISRSTNSCYPLYQKKKDVSPRYRQFIKDNLFKLKSDVFNIPCSTFFRFQLSKTGVKLRMVYGYGLIINWVESYFLVPIINYFIKVEDSSYVTGKVGEQISKRLIPTYSYKRRICIDIKQFDITLPTIFSLIGFEIIISWFKLDHKWLNLFRRCRNYFCRPAVYHPKTGIWYKKRGVPSGSGFTNLLDSVANAYLINYTLLKLSVDPRDCIILVHGDDSVIATNSEVDLAKFADILLELGVEMKDPLVYEDNRVHFLGREWVDGKPTIDVEKAWRTFSIGKPDQPEIYSTTRRVIGRFISIFRYDSRLNTDRKSVV